MLKSSLTAKEKRDLYMKVYFENKEEIDKRISTGIEANRKGNCKIKFVDKNGNPIANKKVKINQKSHDFKYGANIFLLDEFDDEALNLEYRRMFKEYFNLATIPFYWNTLEPEENNPRYAIGSKKIYRRPAPDLCLQYCEESGIEGKLHCLVYEGFMPDWIKGMSLEDAKAKYEKRFAEISERYAGKLMEFEVINELLCYWKGSKLSTDKDILEWSFKTARKHFPNETLVINEGNQIHAANFQGFRSTYYMLIENALLKGCEIDKIGLQNHLFTGTQAKTDEQYDQSIKSGVTMNNPFGYYGGLDIFAEFGLPLEITEVTVPTFGDTEEDEQLQADMLELWYSIWFSHPAVDTVVYWNTAEGHTHVGDNWNENNCRGGLFHSDLTPKKSALKLKELFSKIWHTGLELVTNENGEVDFRGFYGDYTATLDDFEIKISLHKGSQNDFEIAV